MQLVSVFVLFGVSCFRGGTSHLAHSPPAATKKNTLEGLSCVLKKETYEWKNLPSFTALPVLKEFVKH